jgi:hypothetical protein
MVREAERGLEALLSDILTTLLSYEGPCATSWELASDYEL